MHRREVYILNDIDRPDASRIMEIAKGRVMPRVSLADIVKSKKPPEQPKAEGKIPEDVIKLVMLVIALPFKSSTEYYDDLLQFSRRQGTDAKNTALDLKLLVSHEWHSGQRGGKTLLLEATKEAFSMFKLTPEYENPKFMHRFLQEQVRYEMTLRGFRARIEANINKKRIDVLLEQDGEQTAVEIATTDKHEITNVRKDIFQAGVNHVFIIGLNRKVVAAVKKKINKEFSGDKNILTKVTVCILAEFLSEWD